MISQLCVCFFERELILVAFCEGFILFQEMWVYDEVQELMRQEKLTFVPGLYKIFDEILGTCSV